MAKKYVRKKGKKRSRKNYVAHPQTILRTGFPKTTCVKLRYCTDCVVNPTAATIGSYAFRANSVFDPDLTGVGHQPMGFDQWSQFYNKYIVLGSKIKATFAVQGIISGNGFVYNGISLSTNSSIYGNLYTLIEQNLVTKKAMSNKLSSTRPKIVTKTFSAKKFFNVADVKDNSQIGALTTANPGNQSYFVVWACNADSTVDQLPISILVEIEYIVLFQEPLQLPQS